MIEWYILLPAAFALLLLLLFAGVPIFASFLFLNLAGVLYFIGLKGSGLLVNSIFNSSTSLSLAAIPLFILMGEILFRSGSINVLFDSIGQLIGKIRGRLYYFVVLLSTIFGSLSGSAVAVTAMLSNTALKSMMQRGYDKKLSIGMVLSGAALAPIIPPSTLAVIIGSIADVSIAKLLIAGLIPGAALAIIFTAFIAFSIKRNPALAPEDEQLEVVSVRTKLLAIARCLPFSIVILGVMGAILLGIATATEAAATGVAASVIVALYYRKLSFSMLVDSVRSATEVTTMLMVIIISSTLFTQLLALTGASAGLVATVKEMSISPYVFILFTLAITFVMCMFIDQIAFMLMAIPILEPVLKTFPIDPLVFWVLFLIFLSLGSNTPPFGYNLFAMKAVADDITISEIFSAAWRVVWLVVAGTLLFMLFPSIVTLLPSLM